MPTPISTIIHKATRSSDSFFNCLTFPTHERFQSNLKDTKCNYWMLQGTPGVKGNGWISSYAQMPPNHTLLEKNEQNPLATIPAHVNIDFVLGQHKFGQAQTALQIAQYLGLYTILLEHTTVTNDSLKAAVPDLLKVRGDINVFISKSSCEAWGWNLNDPSVRIVEHGVDSQYLFKPQPKVTKEFGILSIVNDWVNRGDILGWDIFNRVVVNNKLPFKILGDNPGISQPAKNVYDLVQTYNKSTVFYNTSRYSPIPSVLLEAMSCGLPCVSTDNYLISEIIVNGVNGYKTNSESEQLQHLQRLLNDPAERAELGGNARKTIEERFNLTNFVENWNNIFKEVVK